MNIKLFRFFQIALFFVVSSFSVFALPNSAIENYRSTIVRDNEGKVQKYSVLVSNVGEPKTNSDFSEHFVQRVDEKYYAKGQIYVKTKHKTDNGKENLLQGASALTSALQSIGSTNITTFADAKQVEKNPGMQKYGLDRLYKISIPLDRDPFEVCAELMQNPDVEYACPVSIAYSNSVKPNDPMLDKQYSLTNMKVFEAWEYSKGSANIKIAIVDSGVDYEHPDLASHIWTNPNEIPDDGIDNDGNGKVDDYRGWDFVANEDLLSLMQGKFKEDNDPMNRAYTHGTNVAGCAGAVPNNGIGIAGVAYNCKVIPLKMSPEINVGKLPFVSASMITRATDAVVYAAELGADVINCSFGTPLYLPAGQDIVNYVTLEKKALIVASAGNYSNNTDYFPFYPAAYKHVLSAGATNEDNTIVAFSNYGYGVTTFAPGTDIYTTEAEGKYKSTDGTSFSAPNVAGVVALVKAIHPDWSPKKLYHQIKSTSDIFEDENYPNYHFKQVNALKAVSYNSPNSDITVPGIEVESFYLNNDKTLTTISDNKEYDITIELKNYLSSTKNLNVKAFSPNGFLELSNTEATIEQLDEDATTTISLKAKLYEMYPWSDGYTVIGIELNGENGNYKDYQMLRIPVKLPEDATSELVQYEKGGMILLCDAVDINNTWAAGIGVNGDSYALRFDAETKKVNFHTFNGTYFTKAMAGIDKDNAYFAAINTQTNLVEILKTKDDGKTFTSKSIAHITNKPKALYFKNKNNGVVIGEAKNGKWNIGTTNNGGLDWVKIENPPEAVEGFGSSMNEKAHERINDCIYFAAANGAVFKSEDFGQTWSKKIAIKGIVYYLAFIDENVGIAYYKGDDYEVAITTDGGNFWKKANGSLPKKYKVSPSLLYADRVNRSFILEYYDGSIYKSDDLAESWKPIRKQMSDNRHYASSVYVNSDGEVAIFQFGEQCERVLYKARKNSVTAVSSKYKLIPNPATNSCQLLLGDDARKVEALEIYSSDGRMMMQVAPNFNDGSTSINTSSLPVGQYNIVLMGREICETVKLIVVR